MRPVFLAAILLLASTAGARPHPIHFIKTHKELLAADAIVFASWGADAASSVHCQRYPKYCVESNIFLGSHPNQFGTWGYSMGAAAGLVAGQHLLWHFAPTKQDRHLIWFTAVPIAVGEYFNVSGNVDSAERIERCYRNGLCK